MRKITDIYEHYRTMPNVQLHQLRVAAVAEQICESLSVPVDVNRTIAACLLHDIGKMVALHLSYFPEFIAEYGLEYWQGIQKDFITRYGTDEHEATLLVAREMGLSGDILGTLDAVGFHNWCHTKEHAVWEHMIACYADSRVSPFGVRSLAVRLEDARNRYKDTSTTTNEERASLYSCIFDMEKEIFAHSRITPEDITDESIASRIERLKSFEL